ncbi:apolipoprotein N-acyltransferase [Fodinibius salinus]|uniref:Apolipoprotein N-acyltransferase n=1 Tax=Fodinibius salinus TaxID=860790 RepID=A0A5D3YL85_9BACT|nr:apolipoprotein N-acyltransferase [Fodinibius salinus]TYP94946.1 apolipoprotein N-acyltransferase [Fodinibius salinus]
MNKLSAFWDNKWALTLSAGLLLGLSWPPIPLPFLVFPAFVLIFRITDLADSARAAAYWTYPAFLIWNIITTYWLVMATVAGGVAAILANAVVMTLPVMGQYKVQELKLPGWLIALFQTAFWLSFEYLHHQWDLAWPWLTIANAWSNVPQLVQYISVTGFWGISFWVLFSSALAYRIIKKPSRSLKITLVCVLFAFPLWSLVSGSINPTKKVVNTQEVVVVQPNFDSYLQYGGLDSPQKANQHLLQLSDSVRTSKTDLIVWPENAIQSSIYNRRNISKGSNSTKQLLKQKAREWNTTFIAGATYYEYYDSDETPSLPYKSNRGAYLPFNAALGFHSDTASLGDSSIDVYRKHNLVPIVERVPFIHFLNAADVFNWISWNQNQGYGKGHQANQFSVGNTQTPALICYDSVYPSWVRKYVNDGAGYLTIITNDGWWGNTSGHEQHYAYARLRAIEFGRWVVRSANNGISGIIAPNGSIKKETPYWEQTAFNYQVPVLNTQTLYARFGDWLPILMLIFSALGIGWVGYRNSKDNGTN